MPNISDEEIEARINAAIEKEQRAIAGDQFYREALAAVAQKTNAGMLDRFVFEVGKDEYVKFQKDNPITVTSKKKKEKATPAPEKDPEKKH